MTTNDIKKASELIHELETLHESIDEGLNFTTVTDWAFGCEVHPHRLAMLEASKAARSAAIEIMRSAAKAQIANLNGQLKSLGVVSNTRLDRPDGAKETP
jgi:hypothetical protein